MKKRQIFTIIFSLILISACSKEIGFSNDVEIRAIIGSDATRVCYTDNSEGGSVALKQEWEVGDQLIGCWEGERFRYEVKTISAGVAFLKWSAGYKLTGTETGICMYYAPGCQYTDIATDGSLPIDIASQNVEATMPAILASCADFAAGSLNLEFSNMAAVLRVDRLCWLPAGSRVSAIKVYGAVSSASIKGKAWSGDASSVITLNKDGGWSADAFGEMNDTLRVVMLPSSVSENITVKAVVEGAEYTIFRTPVTVAAGKYYYPATVGARMVCADEITYFPTVEEAVNAANSAAYDASVTMFKSHTIVADTLKFLNGAGRKITLDFGDHILTGKNTIWSDVEFTSSGSGYATNSGNVVIVRSSGNFTMNGSALYSTSSSSANTASPLCIYSENPAVFGQATIDGTEIYGYSTYGAVYIYGGSLTVKGDAYFSASRSLFVSTNGSLSVNGGTFESRSSQCIHIGASTSVIDINGGTFSAATNLFNFNSEKASTAKVTITAGKFSWKNSFNGTYAGSNVSISGGLFSNDPPISSLAAGHSLVSNTDPETMVNYPVKVK